MDSRPSITIRENVPLAPLTTLGVGGPARYFAKAETEADVANAFRHAHEAGLPIFVLGGGSNILVSDDGFPGLVLQIAIKGVEQVDEDDRTVTVSAGAGEDWDAFVAKCVADGLGGVECLSGIPGYVGGTPVQNVGAYGQDVSETIVGVRCFDRPTGGVVELSNAECGFEYRKSIFNSTHRDRYVVLRVDYKLKKNAPPALKYKELATVFEGQTPSLLEVREAVLRIRRAKSMVIDPADPNSRSAGSFFKNPVVPTQKLDELRVSFEGTIPHFPAGDGEVKLPAAWLIENAGFEKGTILGNAGISANHSLAIINPGNATAADIVKLKDAIRSAVKEKFGVELTPEPVFVGFDR